MRFRRITWVSALCASLLSGATLFTPADAHAQDATTEMARQRFQEGVRFYDAGQYEKARAAFLQAWALKRHPAVLLNLAQSELRSNHAADAANHFAQYLRENTEATAAEKADAESGLTSAKAKVAEVSITAESGAEVFVDGEPAGRAPLPGPVYLDPGSHNVEQRLAGETKTEVVTAIAGQQESVDFTGSSGGAAAAAVPAGPAAGSGTAPAGEGEPPGGDTGFSVSTDDEREPFLDWYTSTPIAWALSGVGVAGLGVGIGMSIASNNEYSDANSFKRQILSEADRLNLDQPPCNPPPSQIFASACNRFQSARDSGDNKKVGSIVAYAVGGAALAGVGVYYFIDGKKSSSEAAKRNVRVGVSAAAAPDQQGVTVVGTF